MEAKMDWQRQRERGTGCEREPLAPVNKFTIFDGAGFEFDLTGEGEVPDADLVEACKARDNTVVRLWDVRRLIVDGRLIARVRMFHT
jgi:hypothetical protein